MVKCYVYENKQINLIQDLYSPNEKLEFDNKQISAIIDKQNKIDVKQIRENVNFQDVDGLKLIDVDVSASILNETKINSKILYEAELNMKFLFENSKSQIIVKEAKIPFEYTLENLQNGESLNTDNVIDIKNQDFILQDGGNVDCNIDLQIATNMYRTANINTIDNIQENGDREEQDYSIVIYVVKKGDTLWNIAKQFGSTVESIAKVNDIENANQIMPGQKLFIPRFERVLEANYE